MNNRVASISRTISFAIIALCLVAGIFLGNTVKMIDTSSILEREVFNYVLMLQIWFAGGLLGFFFYAISEIIDLLQTNVSNQTDIYEKINKLTNEMNSNAKELTEFFKNTEHSDDSPAQ